MTQKVSKRSKKASHPLDDLTLQELAKNTYELFDQYIRAGFSVDQAFELTKIVVGGVCLR